MTCTIHKHIVTVVLAGALMLFMGLAAQAVYAEDDPAPLPAELQGYQVTVDTVIASGDVLLPGGRVEAYATLTRNGEPAALPEGAKYEWHVGAHEVENAETIAKPEQLDDPATIAYNIQQLPEDMDVFTFNISVKVVKDNAVICSGEMDGQHAVLKDLYDVHFPFIDPDMKKGEEATDEYIRVVRYIQGEDPQICDVTYKIAGDDISNSLEFKVGERDAEGKYPVSLKRLRTDQSLEFSITLYYGDEEQEQHFRLHAFSTDLSKCTVMVPENEDKKFTVFEDNWVFFDDAGWTNPGVDEDDISITSGDLTQPFDDSLFEMTEVEKYVGYTENSDTAVAPTKFPLKYDGKGAKNRNGDRTDGTSLYYFVVKAKPGSGWTGQVEKFLFVCNKYSLYNLGDYFAGSVEFPYLAKYVKDWDKDPFMRYEVPKGSKAKKTLTVKIGNDTLTPGKHVTVKYRNDKTKKEYSSFPTSRPGEYTIVLTGKSPYYGTDRSTHLKIGLKNTLAVKGKTVKIKKKQIKKKSKKLKAKKVIKIKKKGKGKLTYKKVSGNKKITVASNGKVTVKKGLKKGKYKVKVKVTAAGTDKYFPITKTVTFKIKVK